MNFRSIEKKIKKRQNKQNQYYAWVRIVFDKKILQKYTIEEIEDLVGTGVNWGYYSNKFSFCIIVNMKRKYIKLDLKGIIKNLDEKNLKYKLR